MDVTYQIGRVSVTNGSNVVTGDGTQDFINGIIVGGIFALVANDVPYIVASRTTNTITLTVPYAGITAVNQEYQVTTEFIGDIPLPRRGDLAPYGIVAEAFRRIYTKLGGGTWGGITGILSDQTDLQNALNTKADAVATTNALNTKANSTDVADGFSAVSLALADKQQKNALLTSVSTLAIVAGDLIIGTANNVVSRLAKSTNGYVLTLVGGLPAWAAPSGGGGGREILTANQNYYVRTDGNDANDGKTNSSGGAFKTIQKAIDVATGLDLSIYSVTINVADGAYTQALNFKSYIGAGPISVIGNIATPANIPITVNNASIFTMNSVLGKWKVSGFKVKTTVSGSAFDIVGNSSLEFGNIEFDSCVNYHVRCLSGSLVVGTGNCAISGGAVYHWLCGDAATIDIRGLTYTLSNAPVFTIFALATRRGGIVALGNTFTGTSATGKRFEAIASSSLNSSGATLPGSIAGTNDASSYAD